MRVYKVEDVEQAVLASHLVLEVLVRLESKDFDCPVGPPPPAGSRLSLIWPAPPPKVLTQAYGIHPEWYKPFGLPGHEGLDLRALTGTQIFAAAAGKVTRVETVDNGPYGKQVRVEHVIGADVYESVYAHFQKCNVIVGQMVQAGEVLGLADNTGNSSGSHLHFTLKFRGHGSPWMNKSDIVNPTPYFPDLFPGKGWTVEAASNLRSAANLQASVIRLLPAGTVVQALDFDAMAGGDWWKVNVGGVEGWVWNPGYKLRAVA